MGVGWRADWLMEERECFLPISYPSLTRYQTVNVSVAQRKGLSNNFRVSDEYMLHGLIGELSR